MAVLALTCVKRSIQNNGEDLQDINHYIESLVKKILSEKKRNGLIGNTYSTGEAMQVSQRLTQEIGKGVTEESNNFILSFWPSKILLSICFLYYLWFYSYDSPPCLKCILLTFNLYLSISNASMKLFLVTISLRNSRVYYNYNLSCSITCNFTLYHIPLFWVFVLTPKFDIVEVAVAGTAAGIYWH